MMETPSSPKINCLAQYELAMRNHIRTLQTESTDLQKSGARWALKLLKSAVQAEMMER